MKEERRDFGPKMMIYVLLHFSLRRLLIQIFVSMRQSVKMERVVGVMAIIDGDVVESDRQIDRQ